MDVRAYHEIDSQLEDRIVDAVLENIGCTPQTDGMFNRAKNAARNAAASATKALETRKNNQADAKVRMKKADGKARVVARDAKHKQQIIDSQDWLTKPTRGKGTKSELYEL
jgi:hypothetical protein